MSDQPWQPPGEPGSARPGERSLGTPLPPPHYSLDRRWWWTGDRWVQVPPPHYSADHRWWWTGDRWVQVPPPQDSSDGRWRWTGARWVPLPTRVAARINWWAWAALAVGVLPYLSPLPFGIIVGIFDERSGGTSYHLSDALPVAALCLPGVILSVIGIVVGRRRDGDGVGIAVAGGIGALAFSVGTLLLMFL